LANLFAKKFKHTSIRAQAPTALRSALSDEGEVTRAVSFKCGPGLRHEHRTIGRKDGETITVAWVGTEQLHPKNQSRGILGEGFVRMLAIEHFGPLGRPTCKARVEQPGFDIGRRFKNFGFEQRRAGSPAFACRLETDKRVNAFVAVTHLEMDVRELSKTRESNFSQMVTLLDRLTFGDANAAFTQVAILRRPSVWMTQYDAVAAFAAAHGARVGLQDAGVFHPVARSSDDPIRGSDHRDPFAHDG
jgi:hypothetical protein